MAEMWPTGSQARFELGRLHGRTTSTGTPLAGSATRRARSARRSTSSSKTCGGSGFMLYAGADELGTRTPPRPWTDRVLAETTSSPNYSPRAEHLTFARWMTGERTEGPTRRLRWCDRRGTSAASFLETHATGSSVKTTPTVLGGWFFWIVLAPVFFSWGFFFFFFLGVCFSCFFSGGSGAHEGLRGRRLTSSPAAVGAGAGGFFFGGDVETATAREATGAVGVGLPSSGIEKAMRSGAGARGFAEERGVLPEVDAAEKCMQGAEVETRS